MALLQEASLFHQQDLAGSLAGSLVTESERFNLSGFSTQPYAAYARQIRQTPDEAEKRSRSGSRVREGNGIEWGQTELGMSVWLDEGYLEAVGDSVPAQLRGCRGVRLDRDAYLLRVRLFIPNDIIVRLGGPDDILRLVEKWSRGNRKTNDPPLAPSPKRRLILKSGVRRELQTQVDSWLEPINCELKTKKSS